MPVRSALSAASASAFSTARSRITSASFSRAASISIGSDGIGMQLQAESSDNLEDRLEARAALSRKCLVETLPGEAGIAGHLGHALGTRDVSESLGDERRIAVSLFETGFEVGCHLLGGSQVFGHIVAAGGSLDHRDAPTG